MRDIKPAFLSFILLSFVSVSGKAAQGIPEKAKLLIDNLCAASDKSDLWPGYKPLLKPLGLHFAGQGTYLVGTRSCPKNTEIVKGFPCPVCFFRDKKADSLSSDFSQSFYTEEAGELFLYIYGRGSLIPAELVIVHETFHLFQSSNFKNAAEPGPAAHSDSWSGKYADNVDSILDWWRHRATRNKGSEKPQELDIADLSRAYIEDQLLAQALLDEKSYKTLAAEFVSVRNSRRRGLPSQKLEHEIKQERIEGTAEYVGWKSIAKDFSPLLAFNAQAGALLSPQALANPVKRFYSPGAAQCFLLDRAGVDWKGRVEKGEDIFDLMNEYFPPVPASRSLAALERTYFSEWLEAALEKQKHEFAQKKARALSQVANHNSYRVTFQSAAICQDYSATCYDDVVELGGGKSYLGNCHIEYRCKGASVSINAPTIQKGRDITVLLGASAAPQIIINKTSLGDMPRHIYFNELSLKTPGLSVELNSKGLLTSNGKEINIEPGR